jgi:hypothetical protein
MERERGWERGRTRGEEGEWEEKGHSGRGKKSGKVGRKGVRKVVLGWM